MSWIIAAAADICWLYGLYRAETDGLGGLCHGAAVSDGLQGEPACIGNLVMGPYGCQCGRLVRLPALVFPLLRLNKHEASGSLLILSATQG